MIGVVGWATLFALLLAWEGLSITVKAPGWPSSSDMVRAATRPVLGRWLLFAAWLWLGWHVFMRGWTFFLAGRGARTPGPPTSRDAGQLLTQVILPLTAAYVALLAALGAGRLERIRRAAITAPPAAPPTVGQRVRHIAVTVACGYGVFVTVMGVYAVVNGHSGGLLASAVREGAFLAFGVALPVFVLITLAGARPRSHHRRR